MTDVEPRPNAPGPSATRSDRRRRFRNSLAVATGTAAALGGLALINAALARRAERLRPPIGRVGPFAGIRLHRIDVRPSGAETGPPVVLLHGNLVTLEDWIASGIVDHLAAAGRRVVAFDRPGFGHSERPRGRWGARDQAALLRGAARALGVERPIVVGHSWGALVALAWSQDAPVAGTALVSG